MWNYYVKMKGRKDMQRYKNLGGNSSIVAYSIGKDYVEVQFATRKIYKYSYKSAGISNVEKMKTLATQGHGLNSYIMHYVRNDYER